jgi:glycosyltransferase involved in cell wall biosynthesis
LAPSIVQVNLRTPYAAQWGLLAAILAPGSRVVAVEHLPLHSYSAGTRWFKRHTSRRLAAHVAVGERTAREVEADAALPAGSIRVIRNGVAAPAGVIAERLAPSPVIGGIGRLDTQKGFDVLVRTLPSLEGGVTAVVVGDGPAAGELKQLAQAEGVLERFVLAGPRASARAALLGLDVFVLSSRFEGLPLVVLEAMASRVPVVATDVGSVREAITDGETGLLVPPESPDALARAIGRLLEDAALKARLVEQAYAVWADRFDVARMIRDYESLYAEVGG